MTFSGKKTFRAASSQVIGIVILGYLTGCASTTNQPGRTAVETTPAGIAQETNSAGIATAVRPTGPDSFVVEARGSKILPLDLIRKSAFLKAAEFTFDTSATRFRVVKATRGDASSSPAGSKKIFTILLDIKTDRTGQPPAADEAWYSAQNVVEGLKPELKLALEKIGARGR